MAPTQYMLPVPYETIEVDGTEWEVVTAGADSKSYVVSLKKPGKGGNLYRLELDLETGEPKGSPRKMGNIEMLEGDSLDGLIAGLREESGLGEARGTQRSLFGGYRGNAKGSSGSGAAASKAPKAGGRAAPAKGKAGVASPAPRKPAGAQIAKTILDQMGGVGRIQMMTGAKNFLHDKNSVSFDFPNKGKGKPNHVKITYVRGRDSYDVEFGRKFTRREEYAPGMPKISVPDYKVLKEYRDIYFDQLIELFEKTTGLYLKI